MSDRPTPRTDGQEFKPVHGCGHFPPYPTVSSAFARQLERELAEARAENLEQARLLGMSAEREADLRGELERENRRAEENGTLAHDLGIQLASFRDERDRLVAALKGISSASPAKWDVPRDEFKHDFEPWAKNVASAALAAVRDSGNTPDQPPR